MDIAIMMGRLAARAALLAVLVGLVLVGLVLVGLVLAGAAMAAPQTAAGLSEVAAALTSGRAAEAERLADAVLADSDLSALDRGRALADRGAAHEMQGKHEAALLDLTQAIGTHALPTAETASALFMRGTILDAQGNLTEAINDYGATLKLQPHFAPAFNNRANAYRRQNRLAEARRDYLASLAAGNSQPEYSYFGLGQIEEAAGRPDAARDFYARSVAANAGYQIAATRLAALGGPREGVVADSQTIHLHPPKAAADEKITLRPPGHPPGAKRSATPAAATAPAAVPGASAQQPGLRPALDAPAGPSASAPASEAQGPQVQLGAWRSEAEAQSGWTRAQSRAQGLLQGLAPHIVPVDLPGRGRYWRLRTGPVAQPGICRSLLARGVECMPVRD